MNLGFATLQDDCRDHVGSEEMKLGAELQQALQHKSHVVTSTARDILKQYAISVFNSVSKVKNDWRTILPGAGQSYREQELATQNSAAEVASRCCI